MMTRLFDYVQPLVCNYALVLGCVVQFPNVQNGLSNAVWYPVFVCVTAAQVGFRTMLLHGGVIVC